MITITQAGPVTELMLNRPERRNALDLATFLELEEAIGKLPATGARVLLIHGAGGNFCAGADLRRVGEVLDADWGEVDQMLMSCGRIMAALRRLTAATVCALDGHAVGAGAALALACDLVITTPSARLALGSFKLGMTPDGGLSFLLARAIGPRNLVKMALTGTDLDGSAMAALGIAAEVAADGAALQRAREVARQVADTAPPLALAGLRELADRATVQGLEEQFELEAAWVRTLRKSADFHEGISAFLERRAPRFRGA